jgi:gas vesicle protein
MQENAKSSDSEERGGFVALAVIALVVGAGAALMLTPAESSGARKQLGRGLRRLGGEAAGTVAQLRRDLRKRKRQARRDKQIIALTGMLVGAAITALLTPESGPVTRERLGGTLSRLKVGAVDRIGRLREPAGSASGADEAR